MWHDPLEWREWKIEKRIPCRKFVLRIHGSQGGEFCSIGSLKLYAAPRYNLEIIHEKLDHRVNYKDAMAYIQRKGVQPLTREELRDHMKGKPLYPGEV